MVAKDTRIHDLQSLRGTPSSALPDAGSQVFSFWLLRNRSFELPNTMSASPVQAEVNPVQHLRPNNWIARWIVRCPDCGGPEDVAVADPRFFCLSCYNEEVGGQWRPVEFPAERERVEALLMERPHAKIRAWLPGETVTDLQTQNRAIAAVAKEVDWESPAAHAIVAMMIEALPVLDVSPDAAPSLEVLP